jgi:hypothetical protein
MLPTFLSHPTQVVLEWSNIVVLLCGDGTIAYLPLPDGIGWAASQEFHLFPLSRWERKLQSIWGSACPVKEGLSESL